MPQFGKRVVGEKAHAEAVRSEKGGAAVFGKRVRGAIPQDGPTNLAKRATEHGPRVTVDASYDEVSIEQLRNILAENPTTFDSLFEVELARDEGARPEALEIFQQVETGIKGAGRQDILEDIRRLLASKTPMSSRQADDATLVLARAEAQAAREKANREALTGGLEPITTVGQLNKLRGDNGEEPYSPTTPSKPSTGGEDDFESMTKADLEKHLGTEAVAAIKGTGAEGAVLKADLVKAATKAAKK